MNTRKALSLAADKAAPSVGIHSLTLTNGAAHLLSMLLRQPEWAKTTKDLYRGGKVLAEKLDDLEPPNPITKEWAEGPFTLELNEGERETCKTCLRAFVEKGAVGAGPASSLLLEGLGMVES